MEIETIISSIITASVSIVICMWQGGWKYTTSPQKEKIEEIRKIVIQLNDASYEKTVQLLQRLKTYICCVEQTEPKDGDDFLYKVHIWKIIDKIERTKETYKDQKRLLIEYLNLLLARNQNLIEKNIKNKIYKLIYSLLLIIISIFFVFALKQVKGIQMESVIWGGIIFIILLFGTIGWLEFCILLSNICVKGKIENFQMGYKKRKRNFLIIIWLLYYLASLLYFYLMKRIFGYIGINMSDKYLFAIFVLVYIAMLIQSLEQAEKYMGIYNYNRAICNVYRKYEKRNRKVRVLHLLKTNSFSGAENVAITICRNLSDQYECAYASPRGEISKWLEKEHITYYPMEKFSTHEFKRIIKEFEPDIVHAHDFSASVTAAMNKKDFYLISHLHCNPPWIKKAGLKSIVYWMNKRKMDQILLVSSSIQKEAVFFSKREKRIHLIGNPVDEKQILKKAQEYTVNSCDLLYVGRFTEAKNPKCFINIVKNMDEKGQKITATMIGNGDLYEECKSYMENLQISATIAYEGFQENPYPYMKEAKILLITSKWEGYGLVAREAITLGTPVLAMDVGGLHEIFKGMPEALCKSEEEMKEKVYNLLINQEVYSEYKDKIKILQKTMMTLNTYLKLVKDIYEESES